MYCRFLALGSKIVGVQHYDGVVSDREEVVLRRQPTNMYDRNAIQANVRRCVSPTRGNRSTGGHEDVFDDDVAYHDSDRPPKFNIDTKDREIHLPNHILLVSMLDFQGVNEMMIDFG